MIQRKKKKLKGDGLKPTVRWIERMKKISDRLKTRNERKIRKATYYNNDGGMFI